MREIDRWRQRIRRLAQKCGYRLQSVSSRNWFIGFDNEVHGDADGMSATEAEHFLDENCERVRE